MDGCQVCNIPPGKVDTRHYTVLNPVGMYTVSLAATPTQRICRKKMIQTFLFFFAAAVPF